MRRPHDAVDIVGRVDVLLDLGVDVRALYVEGGYYGVAKNSIALHVAAWRAQHETVQLLIARGAPVDVRDGRGRTALALAVRACVDSYWSYRRLRSRCGRCSRLALP